MPAQTTYQMAIAYAVTVLRTARDWQDAQHALANHPAFGPWLGDDIDLCQSIIREAEEQLGNDLPY